MVKTYEYFLQNFSIMYSSENIAQHVYHYTFIHLEV